MFALSVEGWEVESPHLFGDAASQPPGPSAEGLPHHLCSSEHSCRGQGAQLPGRPRLSLGTRECGRLCSSRALGSTLSSCPVGPRDSTFPAHL